MSSLPHVVLDGMRCLLQPNDAYPKEQLIKWYLLLVITADLCGSKVYECLAMPQCLPTSTIVFGLLDHISL